MLAALRLQSPASVPQAELWMGSHPRGESRVVRGRKEEQPLRSFLEERAGLALGERAMQLLPPDAEQPELPFLFKILTAEKGLSIQAHPSREAAATGFAREEEAQIPVHAPHRNYRDTNHKPELICALGDFWGLRGFRPLDDLREEMVRLLATRESGLPALRVPLQAFVDKPDAETWGALLKILVDPQQAGIERAALALVMDEAISSRVPENSPARDDRYWWCRELMRQFPGDPGAFAPLYLNLIRLSEGEAMFLEAGVLHAYLFGAGVELMANSDNVLRSGCTSKHVDAAELLSNLQLIFEKPRVLGDERNVCGEVTSRRYATSAREFELTRLVAGDTRGSVRLRKRFGPAIVLAIGGVVVVEGAGPEGEARQTLALSPTESAFVEHETEAFTLRLAPGSQVFLAGIPDAVYCEESSEGA